jgi:alkylation response protein AidB-like acyl-CoA dehydrogenase
LTPDMLERFHERASQYDRDNRFFHEDLEELRESGFLQIAVPTSYGGSGLSLATVAEVQRRLAYHAPATALATNMHIYWTGTAADLLRAGDTSLAWILDASAAGKVFASGHGERGNDLPVFLSTSTAERIEGGYRISGHKLFGSLAPVWDYMGAHAMVPDAPDGPQIVHVFIPRNAPGVSIKETWDTLGMRATRSDDTLLDNVFVPDELVARVVPAGAPDALTGTAFVWVEVALGSIYLGIADRALDLAVETARMRGSIALTRSMAYHPEVQHSIAEAVIALEAASAHIEKVGREWSDGVDHGPAWGAKAAAAKHTAVETAKRVVDLAMTVSGGAGMFKTNELERLYRDVRAGGFHPANSMLVHEIVGKTALGIDPGEQPRWG